MLQKFLDRTINGTLFASWAETCFLLQWGKSVGLGRWCPQYTFRCRSEICSNFLILRDKNDYCIQSNSKRELCARNTVSCSLCQPCLVSVLQYCADTVGQEPTFRDFLSTPTFFLLCPFHSSCVVIPIFTTRSQSKSTNAFNSVRFLRSCWTHPKLMQTAHKTRTTRTTRTVDTAQVLAWMCSIFLADDFWPHDHSTSKLNRYILHFYCFHPRYLRYCTSYILRRDSS